MNYEWIMWERGGYHVENDEGWHYKHCSTCGRKTEHGLTEGCLDCGAGNRYKNTKRRKK